MNFEFATEIVVGKISYKKSKSKHKSVERGVGYMDKIAP